MPINQLTNFSHLSITKNGKCPDCENECDNNCNTCLQNIHFGNSRRYDCQNMIYCYTCSYIYKYASEIGHLFNLIKYNNYTEFNILNLGCGSCADLFGIDSFLRANQRNIPLTYYGVDINDRWDLTQQRIIQIFPHYMINFELNDVFDYLNNSPNDEDLNFNIIVLQYILDEIEKYDNERLEDFIELFVQKIIDNLPIKASVIINDINIKSVRITANKIYNRALESNIVERFQYRFTYPISHTYGGQKHENDGILFNVPPLIYAGYDIKHPCSSYQMLIYKTGNK